MPGTTPVQRGSFRTRLLPDYNLHSPVLWPGKRCEATYFSWQDTAGSKEQEGPHGATGKGGRGLLGTLQWGSDIGQYHTLGHKSTESWGESLERLGLLRWQLFPCP